LRVSNHAEVIKQVTSTWSPEKKAAVLTAIKPRLWRQGDIAWKFHSTQRLIHSALKASAHQQFYLLCSRRLGKTFMLLSLAFQECLRRPGARVLFLAPEKQMAREIATDTAAQLLEDCPADCRPKFDKQYSEFHFPNQAILRLKGVNAEQADSLRGGATDLVIVDEAGQMDNLLYVIQSVVLPMTLTTGGRVIFATTPPITPDHESKVIYDRLFPHGATVKFTLRDAPHIPHARKRAMLLEVGEAEEDLDAILAGERMPKTTAALREYFCEFVTDASQRVVPEFDADAKKEIVRSRERPPYFDAYVAVDPGFQDRTGIIFAYYDFRAGVIVVEDEALLHKPATSDIAKVILEKEWALWGDQKPLLRVSDVDPRLVADLYERHGLVFVQAQKQDALGAINLVREDVRTRGLLIDPRCVNTVHQLENTIWNKKATDFARTTEGHGDLLAALKYLCRTVNRHHNPAPPGYYSRTRSPDEFRSPRRRFREGVGQLDLLGSTPAAQRVKRGRGTLR
jgi:hypothetical protein